MIWIVWLDDMNDTVLHDMAQQRTRGSPREASRAACTLPSSLASSTTTITCTTRLCMLANLTQTELNYVVDQHYHLHSTPVCARACGSGISPAHLCMLLTLGEQHT